MVTLSLSGSPSSTLLTVTIWAVSQVDGVKVRVAGETVAAAVSLLVGVTVAVPAGRVSSTTV